MVTALALATSVACLFVLFVSGATAVTLPAGFEETTVLPGVGKPQDIAIAPNGRVFVAEKTGFIRTFDTVDDTTPTLFADLRTQVHNYGSRGLLSIVADPAFPSKPYVYVYYTMDAPLGGTPPVYGGGSFDACPKFDDPQDGDLDKAGMQTIGQVDNCPVGSRISRLQAAGQVMTGSEKVLVEDFCQQFSGHAGGGLGFDNDGKLIASAGDGSTSQFWDWGQSGSPQNPCGDPPGGVGASLTRPTSEGGRLRAQDVRTTSDPTGLAGSVIRIDPATGAPVGTSGSDTNAKRIIAHGVRDATRLAVRPGTNDIWVTDRGGGYWEEFHRVTPGSTKLNFGWPCYENDAQARAERSPEPDHVREPVRGQAQPEVAVLGLRPRAGGPPGRQLRDGGRARRQHPLGTRLLPVGGRHLPPHVSERAVLRGPPAQLHLGTAARHRRHPQEGKRRAVRGNGQAGDRPRGHPAGRPAVHRPGRGRDPPHSLHAGQRGAQGGCHGQRDIGYCTARCDVQRVGSTDADVGDALTYAWDLDGDNLLDDSTAAQPTFTYTTPGTRTVTLKVTDNAGAFSTATVVITRQRGAQGGCHGQRDIGHRTAGGDVQRVGFDRCRRG